MPSRPTARSGAGLHDPTRRAAGPDPRRRRLRGPGRRRRDAQPAEPRGLLDRGHAAPDHEQPGRLHDRPDREPLDALLERPREGLRHPDRPRQRRRPRGGAERGRGSRSRTARSSATTSSSTSSATAASATTSRTRRPTRSRSWSSGSSASRPCASSTRRGSSRRASSTPSEAEAIVGRGDARRSARPTTGCARRSPSRRRRPPEPVSDDGHRRRRRDRGTRASGCARSTSSCSAVPAGFTVNPKLARQLERRRRDAIESGGIDWGQAEALAFASLLEDGIPIRLIGAGHRARDVLAPSPRAPRPRDAARRPLRSRASPGANASFEVYNSPLSEYAALGFEYGYSVAAPDALVLWEAQFGDFVNGAQIVIDQFVVAGRSKWNQTSRLTLLLPHGYEGNGPEHSSARLERFLQQGAQDNIRVVNCTTAAPVLPPPAPAGARRRRPAARRDDPEGPAPPEAGVVDARRALARGVPRRCSTTWGRATTTVERLVLCSGKVYYDIAGHELHEAATRRRRRPPRAAVPVPRRGGRGAARALSAAPRGRLGAGGAAEHGPLAVDPPPARGDRARSSAESLRYVGRTWKASPSEGYPTAHQVEQDRIVRTALGVTS